MFLKLLKCHCTALRAREGRATQDFRVFLFLRFELDSIRANSMFQRTAITEAISKVHEYYAIRLTK